MSKKTIYVTLTGMNHYFGDDFLHPGMIVKLKKEPGNPYDREAIMAKLPGLGKIGYVANSPYTVFGESSSAGRIYGLFKKKAFCRVLYVLHKGAVCELLPNYSPKRDEYFHFVFKIRNGSDAEPEEDELEKEELPA